MDESLFAINYRSTEASMLSRRLIAVLDDFV